MDSKKIGVFIKELRQKNNMSQSDLAELIPINREAISKWECGRTIPDSSTLLRLSDIFDVSIDEIMYGEYQTKDNNDKFENIKYRIFDNQIVTQNKLNKISKVLLLTLIILAITIIIFLIYYFFNTYESVKIYTIHSESETNDIYLTDGLLVLTGENIYFKLGIFNGIDENEISRVSVYYDKEDGKKIVYEDSSPKDYTIRDYYGYNEYFEIKNKDVVFDSLYIDIHIGNEITTLKLIIKEEYSNKRLFYKKREQSAVEKAELIKPLDNEFTKVIKESFKTEDNEMYYKKIKKDKITYEAIYINETSELLIEWEKDKYTHFITYYLEYENASYSKSDEESIDIGKCFYDKNDSSKTTCDNDIINILNSIIYEITNGRS